MEVSTPTLTILEGESGTYDMRLSEQPVADGWWLFVQVDGVVYIDGELLDENGHPWVSWVPSVGWEVDQDATPGPTPWRNVHIRVPHDDDDKDEFLTFTHEVWDEHSNCPPFLHAVAPVTVRIIDDDRPGAIPELRINNARVTEGGLAHLRCDARRGGDRNGDGLL